MAVYNSSVGSHQDDSDITIINPSIIHEHNDEYVNNTQITNSNNDNGANPDYIFVHHDPKESAVQLEQVLQFYIRDLEQETNTQIDCDRQLIIRLMNLIRPAYSDDQKKMIQLDKVLDDIASLHDKRHVAQNEKLEQLRTEVCHLNKMLLTVRSEHSIYNADTENYSMQNTTYANHSLFEQEQWTAIEDDAKKLQEIVQSQKNQINEIVTLISQTATAPTSLNPINVSLNDPEDTANNQQTTSAANNNVLSTLLKKIQSITGTPTHEEPAPIPPPEPITLENHSPGISPTQSLATLTFESLQLTIGNQADKIEEPRDIQVDPQEPIRDEPHAPIDIPVVATPQNETKKCPVCNHEFALTSNDLEMYDHIENCLFPSGATITPPTQYECPNCNRKYPGNDENTYLQHLSDCYNRDP